MRAGIEGETNAGVTHVSSAARSGSKAACVTSEPFREVRIHAEWFAVIRLSMMRIMARRMKAAALRA